MTNPKGPVSLVDSFKNVDLTIVEGLMGDHWLYIARNGKLLKQYWVFATGDGELHFGDETPK